MTTYDDLFDETAPHDSVFSDKGALDPLADPEEISARDEQERTLARLLNGVHEGYLPTTISVYGPPGTGKTLTTRRVCRAFAARTDPVAVEYVNLKECRTLFSAANEILVALAGAKKGAYEGLDGVFEAIWEALERYPEWPILLLDEIDHITQDSNYDPNDFFYRLLRGAGKLKRDLNLSVILISNQLLTVDLRLDSRVQSAMSGEEVFFPPYDADALEAILAPRLDRAFQDGALPVAVRRSGIEHAAQRWGDARKALRLFRLAGETATERGDHRVTTACIAANLDATDKEATVDKLTALPLQHFRVLAAITGWTRDGSIVQPVTTDRVFETYPATVPTEAALSRRAIREIITDLETMGLVETWIDSRGREGRVKQIETTFDPAWVHTATEQMLDEQGIRNILTDD